MSYHLKEVTIRTNNSKTGLEQIAVLWEDILNGTIPVLFDSNHNYQAGITPVSKYSHYSSDENGNYDLTIMAAAHDFFEAMEEKVSQGLYKKYEAADENGDTNKCTKKAWENVWAEQKSGMLKRIFTKDYESSVPKEFADDGNAHCYLYIAVK